MRRAETGARTADYALRLGVGMPRDQRPLGQDDFSRRRNSSLVGVHEGGSMVAPLPVFLERRAGDPDSNRAAFRPTRFPRLRPQGEMGKPASGAPARHWSSDRESASKTGAVSYSPYRRRGGPHVHVPTRHNRSRTINGHKACGDRLWRSWSTDSLESRAHPALAAILR